MTAGKKRPVKEIAAELDEIGGSLSGAFGRRILALAAELRGETREPTPNQQREADLREGDSDA